MFNIYGKSGLFLGQLQELYLSTQQPGTITFAVDPPAGLVVNNGNPLVVAPATTTVLRTWPNPWCVQAESRQTADPQLLVGRTADIVDGHSRFTIAFRARYYPMLYPNASYQVVFGLQYLGTTLANFMIQIPDTNSKYLRCWWTKPAGPAGGGQNADGQVWTGNNWVNFVCTYDYDTVAETGELILYLDNKTPVVVPITVTNKIGYSHATLVLYESLRFRSVGHDMSFYDFYFSRDKTWDQILIDSFIAKEVIDPSNYHYYWPCKNYSNNKNITAYCEKTAKKIPLTPAYGAWETADDGAITPMVESHTLPMIASVAGTYIVTASSRIYGVPDEALESEKYEADQVIITVLPPLVNEQGTAQLMIYADRVGAATIAMDNPIIGFPANVAVVAGKNQVSGTITGSGICNVTVTLNGIVDTTQFIINAIAPDIHIGPETTLDYEGIPITTILTASSNHPSATILLSSTGIGITIPDPPEVTLVNGHAEFPVTVSNYGEFSVTGAYGGETSICDIHSVNDPTPIIQIGPDTTINELNTTLNLFIIAFLPGTAMLSVIPDDGGVTVPATVVFTSDTLTQEIEGTVSLLGEYTVTASFFGVEDSCTVTVAEVPVFVRIGPDADNATVLNIVTNRPGTVYLSADPVLIIPSSVEVDETLEKTANVIFTIPGTYIITATFRTVQDSCTVTFETKHCYVYGTMKNISGQSLRNVSITFKPVPVQQIVFGHLLSTDVKTVYTDKDGKFGIRLLRGSRVIVNGKIIEIPDQNEVELCYLLDQ